MDGPPLLARVLREYVAAIEGFEDGVAQNLGLGRTDLRCLDYLERSGPASAGDLSRAMRLSTGATTFLVDRLERDGIVARTRDPADRRRVLVELTQKARTEGWHIHEPLARELRSRVQKFSADEIGVVLRFLQDATEAYVANTPGTEEHVSVGDLRRAARELAGLARSSKEVQRSVREVQTAVKEAKRDVQRSAREAQRNVQRAAREVQREIQHALRSNRRAGANGLRGPGPEADPEPGAGSDPGDIVGGDPR